MTRIGGVAMYSSKYSSNYIDYVIGAISNIVKAYESNINPSSLATGKQHLNMIKKVYSLAEELNASKDFSQEEKRQALICLINQAKEVVAEKGKIGTMHESLMNLTSNNRTYFSTNKENKELSKALNQELRGTYDKSANVSNFKWEKFLEVSASPSHTHGTLFNQSETGNNAELEQKPRGRRNAMGGGRSVT